MKKFWENLIAALFTWGMKFSLLPTQLYGLWLVTRKHKRLSEFIAGGIVLVIEFGCVIMNVTAFATGHPVWGILFTIVSVTFLSALIVFLALIIFEPGLLKNAVFTNDQRTLATIGSIEGMKEFSFKFVNVIWKNVTDKNPKILEDYHSAKKNVKW